MQQILPANTLIVYPLFDPDALSTTLELSNENRIVHKKYTPGCSIAQSNLDLKK